MLTHLLVLGVLSGPPAPGTGPIQAGPGQTANVAQGSSSTGGTNIPLGAPVWPRAFDPADRAPYAFDWSTVLATDEEVAEIVRTTMSALGASLGVQIDTDPGRTPIIDEVTGRKTQLWFKVLEAQQAATSFAGTGQQIAVSQLIRTNATPPRFYERTNVLTVRQQ